MKTTIPARPDSCKYVKVHSGCCGGAWTHLVVNRGSRPQGSSVGPAGGGLDGALIAGRLNPAFTEPSTFSPRGPLRPGDEPFHRRRPVGYDLVEDAAEFLIDLCVSPGRLVVGANPHPAGPPQEWQIIGAIAH